MLIPYRSNRNNSAISRLFDDFVRASDLWEEGGVNQLRSVAADVYETPDSIVVETAVPGVRMEDVNIQVTSDSLTISGEAREEEKEEKRDYYQKQLRYGSFAQSVSLPGTVDSEKAQASFENGILKVVLPKSEQAKPKKIEIQAGGK